MKFIYEEITEVDMGRGWKRHTIYNFKNDTLKSWYQKNNNKVNAAAMPSRTEVVTQLWGAQYEKGINER